MLLLDALVHLLSDSQSLDTELEELDGWLETQIDHLSEVRLPIAVSWNSS